MAETKIAVVTGAAQGIGYACAEALAESGAKMVLSDINEEGVLAAAEKLGSGTVGMACDVGKPEQINAMFDKIEADIGPVSILVVSDLCGGLRTMIDVGPDDREKRTK